MLLVPALVAWSTASVASALHEVAMVTTYDNASLHTTSLGSNVNMKLSNFDDKSEERTNDIGSKLKSLFGLNVFEHLGQTDRRMKLQTINKIKKFLSTPRHTLVANTIRFLKGYLLKLYEGFDHVVDDALYEVLVLHFKSHHGLAKAIFMSNEMGEYATQLLRYQVKKWVKGGQEEADVFKLLGLDQSKENPFKSPIFFQWEAFLKAKYPAPKSSSHKSEYHLGWAARKKKIFDVLSEHYKGDLTNVLVVGAKKGVGPWKNRARNLLDFQIKKWVQDKISGKEVFDLLQLNNKESNPLESPVFFKWAKFVRNRHRSPVKAYKVILDVLLSYFESENALVGALDKASSKNIIAQNLLDHQYKVWKDIKNDAAYVFFEILKLNPTESKLFDSPAFSAWVGYVCN
ncbi:hypothetical protein DD238_008230 [Peronospora effusa]|uniref:RxLR effector protein n=1 Tax=Peronospora effusa TaxID=542832 RepID=A0A3M6V7A5_9STRA|nr:hypothetical protein DD238_008230 [Peronospora effusa]